MRSAALTERANQCDPFRQKLIATQSISARSRVEYCHDSVTTTANRTHPLGTGAACYGLPQWAGCLAVAPGLAVFKGQAENHQTPQHWGHHLALGLVRPVQMGSGYTLLCAPSTFFAGVGTPQPSEECAGGAVQNPVLTVVQGANRHFRLTAAIRLSFMRRNASFTPRTAAT